jgi:hypothetical protein
MTNADLVRVALEEHLDEVIETLMPLMAHLGSNEEWSMEDNFSTTESIAALAGVIGLPNAGDQSPQEIAFWREVADEVGVDYEVDTSIGGPTLGSSMYDWGAMG